MNSMQRKIRAERAAAITKQFESMTLGQQASYLKKSAKFFSSMVKTRKKLSETMYLTIRIDEILRCMGNPKEYGRPYVKLHPKTLTFPMKRMRLDVQFLFNEKKLGRAVFQAGKWKTWVNLK